jgi:ELWxxDGT repeat protein
MAISSWRNALKTALRRDSLGTTTRRRKRVAYRPRLGTLEERIAPAVSLVADINTQPDPIGSYPQPPIEVNGNIYFATLSGGLWKSDGTEAGTELLKNINVGSPGSDTALPGPTIANVNGTIFFTGDDGTNRGFELWKTDGTPSSTVMVKDIERNVGPAANNNSFPSDLINVNGTLFFIASDEAHGFELWKSDGTAQGTVLVKDIQPGPKGSTIASLTAMNGKAYFIAFSNDPKHKPGLWVSDGTTAGTKLVKQFDSFSSQTLTAMNGKLFLTAAAPKQHPQVWVSDGTAKGTVPLSSAPSSASANLGVLTVLNDKLFFEAPDSAGSPTLWETDGTLNNTTKVASATYYWQSIVAGNLLYFADTDGQLWKTDGTGPGTQIIKAGQFTVESDVELANADGVLYFAGHDNVNGVQLWRSDGSDAGTTPVTDESSPGSFPKELTAVGDTLFFNAKVDGSYGASTQIWKYENTDASPVMLTDFPGGASGAFDFLDSALGKFFFSGNDGIHGTELWTSDGTPGGTVMVKDLATGPGSSYPQSLTTLNGNLYFVANDGIHGNELWKSDGTPGGTAMVDDIHAGSASSFYSSFPQNLVNLDGSLYFFSPGSPGYYDLWTSDGSQAGTKKVRDLSNVFVYPNDAHLTEANGKLFFLSSGFPTYALWTSDGTEAGTTVVKPSLAVKYGSDLVAANGRVFFYGDDNSIWSSDGTDAGTIKLTGPIGTTNGYQLRLTSALGDAFFISGNDLWKSDGTVAGTQIVKQGIFTPGFGDYELVDAGGVAYVVVPGTESELADWELWKTDGTSNGTVKLSNLIEDLYDEGNGTPPLLVPSGGNVFFRAWDSSDGEGLWKSDGTPAGTGPVKNIFPDGLTDVDGTLYFSAVDVDPNLGLVPNSLWKSNGTAAGTVKVSDVPMTNGGLDFNGDLYFAGDDGVHGNELNAATVVPEVTIEQAASQTDPASTDPVLFDVTFSEPVTGFDGSDVDLSAGTVSGNLSASVTQLTPTTYTVAVTGMSGAGNVVASIPAGIAVDSHGRGNDESTSVDSTVMYSPAGLIGLSATSYSASEGNSVTITASRTVGTEGAVSIDFNLIDGAAHAGSDFSGPVSGSLSWADGESGDKSISIPIIADGKNEGQEAFSVVLSNATGSVDAPLTSTLSAPITIAPSDPLGSQNIYTDADGDKVSISLTGPGSVKYYLTDPDGDGKGPIELIELSGTDSNHSVLNVAVKKPKAPAVSDGLVNIGAIVGTGVKSLNLSKVILNGTGINLNGMVQTIALAGIQNGADIIVTGKLPKKSTTLTITGAVADDTTIRLDAPVSKLTAVSFGKDEIDVPFIGKMTVTGNFDADLNVNATSTIKGQAVQSLTIGGIVDGSNIVVGGGGFFGVVGTVNVGEFLDSQFVADYIATFSTIKGKISSGLFANSTVYADVGAMTLATIESNNGGTPFGVSTVGSLSILDSKTTLKGWRYFEDGDFTIGLKPLNI